MNTVYNAKDIVEMALQSKGKSVDLYIFLARNSENYHVSQFFTELAKDEQKHKIHLEKWLNGLAENKREEAYPGERALYLKALVDENAYICDKAKKEFLEKTISEEEALGAGISFEKDFMLFLHDLKRHASENSEDIIDKLLDEEVALLKEILHLKESLKEKRDSV